MWVFFPGFVCALVGFCCKHSRQHHGDLAGGHIFICPVPSRLAPHLMDKQREGPRGVQALLRWTPEEIRPWDNFFSPIPCSQASVTTWEQERCSQQANAAWVSEEGAGGSAEMRVVAHPWMSLVFPLCGLIRGCFWSVCPWSGLRAWAGFCG